MSIHIIISVISVISIVFGAVALAMSLHNRRKFIGVKLENERKTRSIQAATERLNFLKTQFTEDISDEEYAACRATLAKLFPKMNIMFHRHYSHFSEDERQTFKREVLLSGVRLFPTGDKVFLLVIEGPYLESVNPNVYSADFSLHLGTEYGEIKSLGKVVYSEGMFHRKLIAAIVRSAYANEKTE